MPLKKAPKDATKKETQAAVSANIKELTKTHPEWPKDKIIAASINAAKPKKKK